MSKVTQIDIFCLIFLIECFDSILWSLEYSVKFLFKDYFTENHPAFETKTYKQNCFWKMPSFKKPSVKEM